MGGIGYRLKRSSFLIFCDSDKENFISILVTVLINFRLVSQLVSNEGVCRGFSRDILVVKNSIFLNNLSSNKTHSCVCFGAFGVKFSA